MLPFLSGLIGAVMLYVITRRPHAALSRVVPPRVSAASLALGSGLLLVIPGAWFVSSVVSAAADGLRSLQSSDTLARLAAMRVGTLDVGKEIVGISSTVLTWVSSRAFALFGSLTLTTLNLIIALLGVYYILIDGGRLWRSLTRLVPLSNRLATLLGDRFVTLAVLGYATLWMAVVADMGTSLAVILNGMRLLGNGSGEPMPTLAPRGAATSTCASGCCGKDGLRG